MGGLMLAVALGAVPGSALPGAAAAAPVTPVTHNFVIEQMRFHPPTLTVRRGDRIDRGNKDLFAHTSSSAAKVFDSGSIAPNASWSHLASKPGSFPYLCHFHPTMRGTLNVR